MSDDISRPTMLAKRLEVFSDRLVDPCVEDTALLRHAAEELRALEHEVDVSSRGEFKQRERAVKAENERDELARRHLLDALIVQRAEDKLRACQSTPTSAAQRPSSS